MSTCADEPSTGALVDEPYRALAESSPDMIGRYDRDLRYVYVNPAIERASGRRRETIVGRRPSELGDPPELCARWEEAARAVFASSEPQVMSWSHPTPIGPRWFESRLVPEFSDGGEVEHVAFTTRDLTELKAAQEFLADRLAQQVVVAELASSALQAAGIDGLLEQVLPSLATLLDVPFVAIFERGEHDRSFGLRAGAGWNPGSIGEARLEGDSQAAFTLAQGTSVVCPDVGTERRFPSAPVLADHAVRSGMSAPIRTPTRIYGVISAHATEARVFAYDEVLVLTAVAGILGSAIGRLETEQELRDQALHDPLTGLANRTYLLRRTEDALAARARSGTTVALMFLDLDNFKPVNDSLGHDAGNEILVQIARRLAAVVRRQDTVARIGGDEFVILCEGFDPDEDVAIMAQRVHATMSEPYLLRERHLQMTASLGVATAGGDVDAQGLLRSADLAMYRAKERGRARIEVFDDTLRRRAERHLEVQFDLRDALDRGELRLAYQPQVAVDDWRITGAEALVRWMHPTRGLLSPGDFLPVAEKTGLIAAIGTWVRAEALRQLAAWDHQGTRLARLAINLSSRDLADTGLAAELTCLMTTHGIDPQRLAVEVTETAIMHDVEAAQETLEGLSRLGVTIALDDFGTGYSSLRHLHELPVDVVKIDRTFVARLDDGPGRRSLVAGTLALLQTLDLAVVAEGVETTSQLLALQQLGCPTIQGYLCSPPVPGAELAALVREGIPLPRRQQSLSST